MDYKVFTPQDYIMLKHDASFPAFYEALAYTRKHLTVWRIVRTSDGIALAQSRKDQIAITII